jgi:hypothetical protein
MIEKNEIIDADIGRYSSLNKAFRDVVEKITRGESIEEQDRKNIGNAYLEEIKLILNLKLDEECTLPKDHNYCRNATRSIINNGNEQEFKQELIPNAIKALREIEQAKDSIQISKIATESDN